MNAEMDRRRFLGTAVAGIAGVASGAALAGASRARASAPAKPDGPNVLVIVIDSLRFDHVGANGSKTISTPNIDALAKESLRFTRSYPEAMPTVPARRSLVTSRRVYPWTTWRPTRDLPDSPGWSGISSTEETWLRAIRAHGYWTGYVTDNPFLGFSPEWAPLRRGVDRFQPIAGRVGVRHPASSVSLDATRHWLPKDMQTEHYIKGMRQHLANVAGAKVEAEQGCARVFTHAISMLEEAERQGRPFALVVDSFDPHEPWTPVQKYLDMYGDDDPKANQPGNVRYRPSGYLTAGELRRLPQLYSAAVTQADTWLGHFLDRFYASSVADRTAVVFLSDHGILLGDRGWTGKPALELHPELIHVPFLLRSPDKRGAGRTTDYFVSPHDVGPTALAIAGAAIPESMNGSDVTPLLSGGRPKRERPFWFGGYANHWYYRDDRWAMIADGNDRGRELFDLLRDPGEVHDIAHDHLKLMGRLYGRVLHATGLKRLPFFGKT